MDYANTTNVELIVDPKVFLGWLIYSFLQTLSWSSASDCQRSVQIGSLKTLWHIWSYCLHRRYSMSRQKNRILIKEHALNREQVPLSSYHFLLRRPATEIYQKSSLRTSILTWNLTGNSVKKHQILKIGHFSFLPPLRHCGFLEKLTRGVERCGSNRTSW